MLMQLSTLAFVAISAMTQVMAGPNPMQELVKRDYYSWKPTMYNGTMDQFASDYCTSLGFHCITVKSPKNGEYAIARGTYGVDFLHKIPVDDEESCIDRDFKAGGYAKRTCAYRTDTFVQYACQQPGKERGVDSVIMIKFGRRFSQFTTWVRDTKSDKTAIQATFYDFDKEKVRDGHSDTMKLTKNEGISVQSSGSTLIASADMDIWCEHSSN